MMILRTRGKSPMIPSESSFSACRNVTVSQWTATPFCIVFSGI